MLVKLHHSFTSIVLLLLGTLCYSQKIKWGTEKATISSNEPLKFGKNSEKGFKNVSPLKSGLKPIVQKENSGFGNIRDYSKHRWVRDTNSPKRNWTSVAALEDIVLAGNDAGEIWATQMGNYSWVLLPGTGNGSIAPIRSISFFLFNLGFFTFVTDNALYVASIDSELFEKVKDIVNGHQCLAVVDESIIVTGNATGQNFLLGFDGIDGDVSLFPSNNFPIFSSVYIATAFFGNITEIGISVYDNEPQLLEAEESALFGIPYDFYSSVVQYPIFDIENIEEYVSLYENLFTLFSVANYSGTGQLLFSNAQSSDDYDNSTTFYEHLTVISNYSYQYIAFDHLGTMIAATNYSNSILMNTNPFENITTFEEVPVPCMGGSCKFNQIGLSNYGPDYLNSSIVIGDFNYGQIWFYLDHNPFDYPSASPFEIVSYDLSNNDPAQISIVII